MLRVAHEPPPDLVELSKPADPAVADSPCPGCVTAAVEEDLAEDPRAPPVFGRGCAALREEASTGCDGLGLRTSLLRT